MNTSFTSALLGRAPSDNPRRESHFRRRSQSMENSACFPSVYSPTTLARPPDPSTLMIEGDHAPVLVNIPQTMPPGIASSCGISQFDATLHSSIGLSGSSFYPPEKGEPLSTAPWEPSKPTVSSGWGSLRARAQRRKSSIVASNSNPYDIQGSVFRFGLSSYAPERLSSHPHLIALAPDSQESSPGLALPFPVDPPLITPASIRRVDPLIAATSSTNPYVSSQTVSFPDYSQQQLTSPRPPALFTLPHRRHNVAFADQRSRLSATSPRLFSSIAHHTSNFTRKFPLPWKSVDKFNAHEYDPLLEPDWGDRRNSGLKVLDQQDGYGLDGDSIRIGKWTPYKWALVVSISVMFVISMGGILASLAIWLRTFLLADVILVINWDLVLYSTVASGCILITSLVGITGAILNSRPFLTFYNILLWPCLISLTTVGYTSYKRRAFNLLGKINQGWSRQWGDYGRLVIQNSLHCCGLYNPLHLAIFSKTCYPRSTLPACRPKLSRFQISVLNMFTRAAFSVTGIILLSIVVAVICSNHVNRLFGKGLMPFQYRLRMGDVRANARAVSLKSLGRAVQPKTVLRPGSIEPV